MPANGRRDLIRRLKLKLNLEFCLCNMSHCPTGLGHVLIFIFKGFKFIRNTDGYNTCAMHWDTYLSCRISSSDWLVFKYYTFNLLKPTGQVMHQQFNIQQLYALPTLYLCILYLSENKQRLVPLTP